MNPHVQRILQSKADFRKVLANRPLNEKLAMLDALRERELFIRQCASPATATSQMPDKPVDRTLTKN